MPTLSADQQDDLNYKLQSAYTFQNEVLVTYYDKNDFHTAQGVIIRTDMYNKLIFIGEEAVSALAITKIEIL